MQSVDGLTWRCCHIDPLTPRSQCQSWLSRHLLFPPGGCAIRAVAQSWCRRTDTSVTALLPVWTDTSVTALLPVWTDTTLLPVWTDTTLLPVWTDTTLLPVETDQQGTDTSDRPLWTDEFCQPVADCPPLQPVELVILTHWESPLVTSSDGTGRRGLM